MTAAGQSIVAGAEGLVDVVLLVGLAELIQDVLRDRLLGRAALVVSVGPDLLDGGEVLQRSGGLLGDDGALVRRGGLLLRRGGLLLVALRRGLLGGLLRDLWRLLRADRRRSAVARM